MDQMSRFDPPVHVPQTNGLPGDLNYVSQHVRPLSIYRNLYFQKSMTGGSVLPTFYLFFVFTVDIHLLPENSAFGLF